MSDADLAPEVYPTKVMRTRISPVSRFSFCKECRATGGHEVTCSQASLESLGSMLAASRKSEQLARNNAAKWLESVRATAGKLAVLKHENNKLRANNRKLQDRLARAEAALVAIRDSKYCAYTNCDQYGVGVTDGHRHCARVAGEALSPSSSGRQGRT